MNKIKLNLNQKIHFIGIGGIGMSGLAQIMKNMGFKVQGSDMANSKNVERCRKIGIKIFKSHKKENINNISIVIKSSAIKNSNPEIKAAKEKNAQKALPGEVDPQRAAQGEEAHRGLAAAHARGERE